jgi:galactose mutarotase-like enzyme
MITLENNTLKVQIAPQGAELQSIYNVQNKLEHVWQGDPTYWSKRSPILFPIVGQLKDDTYYYKDKAYHLPRHGFAREKMFTVESENEEQVTFLLTNSEETLAVYPFEFELRVHYELQDNILSVIYDVLNTGNDTMYFSVGGHPAFGVPYEKGSAYKDYYLEFEDAEHTSRYTLQNGLIDEAQPFLQYEKRVPLHHQLFYKDAIVLKNLLSGSVALKSDKSDHGLHFNFEQFPFLGIWAAKDAPFVCIEPWQGIADTVQHNQQLTEKEGIVALEKGHRHQQGWSVAIF